MNYSYLRTTEVWSKTTETIKTSDILQLKVCVFISSNLRKARLEIRYQSSIKVRYLCVWGRSVCMSYVCTNNVCTNIWFNTKAGHILCKLKMKHLQFANKTSNTDGACLCCNWIRADFFVHILWVKRCQCSTKWKIDVLVLLKHGLNDSSIIRGGGIVLLYKPKPKSAVLSFY